MMKRFLAILCSIVLCLSVVPLTAGAATTTTSSKLIATNIPKSFPVIKQDPTSTVVNFWHAMTGTNGIYVSNICNWYNATEGKKNKIYIKDIFQGDYTAIAIKLQAALQSKNLKILPDLVQLSSTGAFSIKESKDIIYMEDLMSSDKTFKIADKLNKNALWACSYKGKQLGMPFSNSMIMMHYNADAFKTVGLDPANPPKTFAEYAKAAAKLTIKGTGKKPVRWGTANQNVAYVFCTNIPRIKTGAYQFDMEDGRLGSPTKFVADTDGTLKNAFTEWKKVLDTGMDYSAVTPRTNFFYGLYGMYMDSMVHYEATLLSFKGFKDKSKIFDYRMARIPTVNASDSVGEAIGGSAVYMFDKQDDVKKAATWKFVKFLASADVSAYWYVASGYFPLNNDALNTKYVQDVLKAYPLKKVPLETRKASVDAWKFQEPWIPSLTVYLNAVNDQNGLLAQGKVTVDAAVSNVAKKANQILKIYNDANN